MHGAAGWAFGRRAHAARRPDRRRHHVVAAPASARGRRPRRRVVVFEDAGEVVAWAVLWLPVTLTYGVHLRRPTPTTRARLVRGRGRGRRPARRRLARRRRARDAGRRSTAAATGSTIRTGLAAPHGARPRRPSRMRRPAGRLPLAQLRRPSSASRVDAHRSAFHPSRVTVESYGAVVSTPPYRADLDVVALAPDGTVAAYALAWLDEENGSASSSRSGRTRNTAGAGSRGPSASRRSGGCGGRARTPASSTRSTAATRPRSTSPSGSARSTGTSSSGGHARLDFRFLKGNLASMQSAVLPCTKEHSCDGCHFSGLR